MSSQIVAYSGFSSSNYIREAYSSDLDFGTGEWSSSAWVNAPTTFSYQLAPVGNELSNTVLTVDGGVFSTNLSVSTKKALYKIDVIFSSGTNVAVSGYFGTMGPDNNGFSTSNGITSVLKAFYFNGSTTTLYIYHDGVYPGTKVYLYQNASSISIKEVLPTSIFSRGHTTGPSINLSYSLIGNLQATAFDGTNPARTVTTTAAYNTGTWLKAEANYRAGRLSILVNGQEVAVTNGAPLLTLNNSNAVLTIGNSYDLTSPFPGSLALLKLSATVPTPEQSLWMYEQEKQMFRDGAQITLPDATAIADLSYDDLTDKWIAVSATNESEWSGLVRTSTTPVPAGSYIKTAAGSGVQLLARSTTNPGVDITMPPTNIKARLKKKAEKSRRNSNAVAVFDFTPVQFTGATLTNGSNIMTASTVAGTPLVGMTITGTGITAGTTIIGINGTSYYLSANYTGTTGSYTVSQASFVLPVGYTAQSVYSGGVLQREGATKNYTRAFDGFRETIIFATSPGTSVVQIHCVINK